MKDLKERLKAVRELLTHAKLIRTKSDPACALEATEWEIKLQRRIEELETEIAKMAPKKEKEQPELVAHAE